MLKYQALLAFFLYLTTSWASASPFTIGGQEWLSLQTFNASGGISWNDLADTCSTASGECKGALGGVDLSGWVWAEADDVNALFNSYLPGTAPPGSSAVWTDLGPGPDSASTSIDFWARQWARSGITPSFSEYTTFPFTMHLFDFWAGWLRDAPGAQAAVLTSYAPYPGVPGSSISTRSSWLPDASQYPADSCT